MNSWMGEGNEGVLTIFRLCVWTATVIANHTWFELNAILQINGP